MPRPLRIKRPYAFGRPEPLALREEIRQELTDIADLEAHPQVSALMVVIVEWALGQFPAWIASVDNASREAYHREAIKPLLASSRQIQRSLVKKNPRPSDLPDIEAKTKESWQGIVDLHSPLAGRGWACTCRSTVKELTRMCCF